MHGQQDIKFAKSTRIILESHAQFSYWLYKTSEELS
jgi:hypothetical protein